jgi:hypothetical protein
MDSLSIGSTWLVVAANTLGPLVALLIGFIGTDRFLRRQFAEKRGRAPLEGAELGED